MSMSAGPISLSHDGIEGYVADFSGLGMRPYDNFNVLVESSQEAHEAFDGVFPEMAPKEAGHFRLSNTHKGSGLRLVEFALVDEAVQGCHNLRFQEVVFGV